MKEIIPFEIIERRIFIIRDEKVMIDYDLAELYGVETKQLKRAVRRNMERFPKGFMFKLNQDEINNLRRQNGTSRWGGVRYSPFAFTEQGVAILRSKRAIQVNILIIQTFVKLRKLVSSHKDIVRKIEELEKKYDKQFKIVFDTLRSIVLPKIKSINKIGFLKQGDKGKK